MNKWEKETIFNSYKKIQIIKIGDYAKNGPK